jgi:NAD(P)-dependent dehydrogenase (short-subunit alcohol dehydrogenase family)
MKASNDAGKDTWKGKKAFLHHLEKPPIRETYFGTGKLEGKVAIVTGGDSGIGRAVSVHYAREGANICIVYHKHDKDARDTKKMVEKEGTQCILFRGDVSMESFCKSVVQQTWMKFKRLDILVNNAGMHKEKALVKGISRQQLIRTFEVNLFSCFYFSKAALAVMQKGSVIINTASVVAYRGSEHLIDYSSTKGAMVTFTRSMAENLAKRKIRVNGVAPGPTWTPLVIEAFDAGHLKKFGKDTPLGRAGYPQDVAPAYVWLACEEGSYMTGQVIHVNGGDEMSG